MIRSILKRRREKRMLRSMVETGWKLVDQSGTLYARSFVDQSTGKMFIYLQCVEPTCSCHGEGEAAATFGHFWRRYRKLGWKIDE